MMVDAGEIQPLRELFREFRAKMPKDSAYEKRNDSEERENNQMHGLD
jgi:hypothetical protein